MMTWWKMFIREADEGIVGDDHDFGFFLVAQCVRCFFD